MCGICGVTSIDPAPSFTKGVRAMNAKLAHRGPDSDGYEERDGIGIAIRRLAIIDLETGDQPMPSGDGAVHVVLNGEIYNYRELRKELQSRGHRFKTRSDTEVVANGYLQWGDELIPRLSGMFAIAVHDHRDGSLFLARDRFGEKPLFYHATNDRLVFSSELQSLMEWPDTPRVVDLEALSYFLRFGYPPTPLTMLQDVRELDPGSTLLWKSGTIQTERYYEPDYTPDPALSDPNVAIGAVQDARRSAVARQMVSDVPLGAFLSGGIDSSGVVALMQEASSTPIKTYTVRFQEEGYDEGPIARAVADHLGTEHHELVVENAGFTPDDLWRIVDHVGQPFADSSAIPTHVISQRVSEEVKVCLTGDGGDDMFAGYDRFRWAAQVDRLGRLPGPMLKLGGAILSAARRSPGLRSSGIARRTARAIEAATEPANLRMAAIESLFSKAELGRLIADPNLLSITDRDSPRMSELPDAAKEWTQLRRHMHLGISQKLPRDYLVKIDRMSMASSLELRAPLLDPEVTAISMRLPDNMLIRDGVQKYALREAVRPLLPDVVFSHPKTGFSVPLHRFQNDAYRDTVMEILGERTGVLSLLNGREIDRIIDLGLNRKQDRADISVYRASHQLWALLQLGAWSSRFGITL